MLRVDLTCPLCGKATAGVGLHRDGEAPVWMTLCGCKVASTPGADLEGIRRGVFKLRDENEDEDHDDEGLPPPQG